MHFRSSPTRTLVPAVEEVVAELEACQQRCDILKRQVSSLEQELEIAKPISYESEIKALKSRVQGALEQVTT